MEMETKRVTEDFIDRATMISWTPNDIKSTMESIERFFEECDEELAKAEMPSLGYEKQPIDTIIEHMVILKEYVRYAHLQCYNELDHPLFKGFKNGATETLSNIILEEITTDNTFEMQRYVEVYDETGHYFTSELKMVLTMKDFLGLDAVIPEDGVFVIANVEAIGWFTDLFRADYENMGASVESLDQMLEMYLYSGEYSHSEYHPIGDLISGILDVTIIKPFIESIYGKDLITGEKLTDFERGMQFVNAVVGAVTFGQGALALDFSEMTAKEIAVELVKIWGVDAIADASAYTAGYACDELGMPAGVSFLASMLTGCTVSVGVGGYVFTDSNGKIVKELDADEMQTWLKSMVDDLDDMTGGGGKGSGYSNLGDMPFIDEKKYSAWNNLREEGLSYEKAAAIKFTDKGKKPAPETYLSETYIENHLQSFKDNGAIKIMSSVPTGTIGGKGGTFVMSGDELDEVIRYANGNVSKIEEALCLDTGYLGNNPVIVMIEDTSSIRVPSGNELGAWPEYWEPGGYTRSGIKEAVIDPITEGNYTYKYLFE